MLLSIVIPVYNEADSLPSLITRLGPVLENVQLDCEVLFIDDGSSDSTGRMLESLAAADCRVKVFSFSRNFGHQAAITAGLDFAEGDAVAIMDADLQDPPELLPEMVQLFRQGYDVVSAQRQARPGDGFWKRLTAATFYWFMRRFVDERLPAEVGDFRLFSKTAVLALREFREQHRFMRGLVAWLGLKEIIIPFHRGARAHGTTKYPIGKMITLAWTAISSFSALPLRVSTATGLFVSLFGLAYFIRSVFAALIARTVVPGWTSLVCLQIIFSGAILMAVGVLGNYVARIYEESKQRPLYVVSGMVNAPAERINPSRGVILRHRPDSAALDLTMRFGCNGSHKRDELVPVSYAEAER
jgi:dolichol-phosphate mannosyltransferase